MRAGWGMAGVLAVAMGLAGPAVCAEAPVKTVALTRMVIKMAPGTQWAVIQKGIFCTAAAAQTWGGGESEVKVAAFIDTFRDEFKKGGLNPEGEASLFDPAGASPAEFALAGVWTDERLHVCIPDTGPANANNMKGVAGMTIDWQLYSRLEKQVVARVHTTGDFTAKDVVSGGVSGMMNRAFAENVRQLAADPALRKVLSGAGLAEGELVKPPALSPYPIPGALTARAQPVDKEGRSVVVIYSGNTLGSGFLISQEGYILTDAHVVGDAANVRLRWADGADGVGVVVRVSKERDVALIKTDAKGHDPMPLRQDSPQIGATVFAIGAPDGQKFEGTVTRGVISASRVYQGFTYIQSDVTTGHGASGGPLLDEYGRVVGLTEGGLHTQTSSGISLFTPIKDAVAFLGLDLR